jgi:hypothetical protein
VPLLKYIKNIGTVDNQGFVSFEANNSRIYGDNNTTLDYFLSSYQGKSAIFVHVEGGKYRLLSQLGKSRKLNESIGLSNSTSLIASNLGTTNKPGPRDSKPADVSTINEDTGVVRTVDCL